MFVGLFDHPLAFRPVSIPSFDGFQIFGQKAASLSSSRILRSIIRVPCTYPLHFFSFFSAVLCYPYPVSHFPSSSLPGSVCGWLSQLSLFPFATLFAYRRIHDTLLLSEVTVQTDGMFTKQLCHRTTMIQVSRYAIYKFRTTL